MIEILLIALSLAMDSFSSSIVYGSLVKKKRSIKLFMIPLSLGVFHILNPLLGWKLGVAFEVIVQSLDHWIAFFILGFIGVKMVYMTMKPFSQKRINLLNLSDILAISIATSIDAFVVGISFAFLNNINIYQASFIIGLVTFLLSMFGLVVGRKINGVIGKRAGIIGGVVLVLLGVKILLEHTLV